MGPQPRPLAIDAPLDAFLRAEYRRALELIEGYAALSPEHAVLRLQILLRQGKNRAAVTATDQIEMDSLAAPLRARALAYRASACGALGEFELARAAIAQAKAVPDVGDAVRLEVAYTEANSAWKRNDVTTALAVVEQYIDVAGKVDPLIHARFLSQRGWLCAAQGQFGDQAVWLQRAIDAVESAPVWDVGLLAHYVFSLAALVRDVAFREGRETAIRVEATLPWTQDVAHQHFETVRAIAWAHALEGEYITAFRKFNSAIALAASPTDKLLAHLDTAEIARFCKEDIVAQAELDEAVDIIEQNDWSEATYEEARAFVSAAELMAPIDVQRAERFLKIAEALRERMDNSAGYAHDNRLAAHADYADAQIRLASNNRRLAKHRALRAYRVLHEVGYGWRAARCALLLHNLGEQGEWLQRAQESIAGFPRSFVAEEIAHAAGQRNPLHDLSKRQVEILQQLRTGRTINEIGEVLGISANTVRVHITNIHRAFGVERRSELLREAARWLDVA